VARLLGGLLILCILCQTARVAAQEGSLQKIRDDVKGDKQPAADLAARGRSGSDEGEHDECLGQLAWAVVAAPFVVPYHLLQDNLSLDGRFPAYPYADGLPFYMWIRRPLAKDEEKPPWEAEFDRARYWSGRLAIEESNDLDAINRLSVRLLLEAASRFGLQTNWSYVHESLSGGRSDETALGDLNLTFRFAQHENAQFRAGLGARLMSDAHGTDWGFNFTYGADVYPIKPLVLSATLDAGTLGRAGVFRGQASVGVLFRRWEIYTGYDYLRIGSTALQGPTLGLRMWF
jgi:hypothetical protein